MADPQLVMTFASPQELEREFANNLRQGGAFVTGEFVLSEADACELVLVHPMSGATIAFRARVVWVHPPSKEGGGVGVQIEDFTAAVREQLDAFVREHATEPTIGATHSAAGSAESADGSAEPAGSPGENAASADAPSRRGPQSRPSYKPKSYTPAHERVRRLTTVEQVKLARKGDLTERVLLERIYGKAVWEPLLRNPRLTPPEVARLARMGTMPVPLLEQIANNQGWLSHAQVRRALLSNRRLGRDLVTKVLRATPKAELKLVPKQTAYPLTVRQAAKRMLHS